MGIDNKYGRVTTEFGTIGEDEPVVVFRAQDQLLLKVLDFYSLLCEAVGSPSRHLLLIDETSSKIRLWQATHPTQVPQSHPATVQKGHIP